MPPLIHLSLAWIAALFVGEVVTDASALWIVATLSAAFALGWLGASDESVVAVSRRRVAVACSCAAVAGAALAHAHTGRAEQRSCVQTLAADLSRGAAIRAVFDERIDAKQRRGVGVASGTDAASRDCRTKVWLRREDGDAPAGTWVIVRGTAIATDRGLRITGAVTPESLAEHDWRRQARAHTGQMIDRDFGRHAALVRALLIADQDGIPPTERDLFADAGLVHMLSISGLHVAIIAGSLLTLAVAVRLSRGLAFAVALAIITVYVAAIGAPPPAVRSAVMLAVVGASERLQRPTHPWTALALGAVIPTVQPDVVLDLGWQLSVSGMAALVAAGACWRRLRHSSLRDAPVRLRPWLRRVHRLDGWRASLARGVLTGVVATAVTAPIIAWTFGRISLIAPISNLVAEPIVAFAQPALFLAIVLSPVPTISQFIAQSVSPALDLLEFVASVFAAVPHAVAHVAPTFVGACCAGIASAAMVRATASRRWLPGMMVAAAALTLAVWSPWLEAASGELELHVIDVGQGDAIALRTPRGRWVLVDAGRTWEGGDAGRRTVVPYIRRLGGEVVAFVLSHAHDDHVGGAASVVAALGPSRWWEPAFVTASGAYRRALVAVRTSHAAWHRVHPGDEWTLDGVSMEVLAPDSAWTAAQHDANETSVVLRVAYRDIVILLTGDAEANEERWILDHVEPAHLRADVLKLGHHGSKTSSSEPFLDAVRPRLGLVSVGAGNMYGHPSPETLRHFAARDIPLLRTDQEQTIVLRTDGHQIAVQADGATWTLRSPSPR